MWVLYCPTYFNCCSFLLNTTNCRSPSGYQPILISKKWEFVVCHNLNPIFLLRGRGIRFVCPYFCGELKVSVSCRRVHRFLKLFQPVFYIIFFILTLENHQAVILIDSVVDCRAEVKLGFFRKVKKNTFNICPMNIYIRGYYYFV